MAPRLKGGKTPSAKKMWNEDWSPKYGGKSTGAIKEMKGVQEIEHLDRVLMTSKPHFEKYGLKPNEITRMSHDETNLWVDPDEWFSGNKTQFFEPGTIKYIGRKPSDPYVQRKLETEDPFIEDLGEVWHRTLDHIKSPTEVQYRIDKIGNELPYLYSGEGQTRKILTMDETAIQSIKDARYLGEKNGVEFFEVDGIPIARLSKEPWDDYKYIARGDIYLPNMKGMERLSGSKKMLQKELEAEKTVERAFDKAYEGIKDTPRPKKIQKIIDAKRKAEGKAHGGIVDKAIVGGERYI